MIPEFGHYALILAFCIACIQGVLPLLGAHQGRREWLILARPAAQTRDTSPHKVRGTWTAFPGFD